MIDNCVLCKKDFKRDPMKDPKVCRNCQGKFTGGYQMDQEKLIATMDKLFYCCTCGGHYLYEVMDQHVNHVTRQCRKSFRMDGT